MAAGIFQPFASAGRVIFRGGDLFFTSLRLALVTSAWLPDIDTETTWGEVSAHELPDGDGYTAGGKTLENVSISDVEGGMKISSSRARWDSTGAGIPAWRYMVLYIAGTVGGVANPLIGFALGDDTPADVPATPSGQSLFIPCPAGGWIELALLTAEDFATKAYADLQLVLAKAYADAKDLILKAYVDARETAIKNFVEAGYVGFDDLSVDDLLADATIGGSPLVTEAETPELGSNSNGYWAKFPSGLMICWDYRVNEGSRTAAGTKNWPTVFPAEYIDLAITIQGTYHGATPDTTFVSTSNIATTGCSIYVYRSLTTPCQYNWIAIGRWK